MPETVSRPGRWGINDSNRTAWYAICYHIESRRAVEDLKLLPETRLPRGLEEIVGPLDRYLSEYAVDFLGETWQLKRHRPQPATQRGR